MDDDDDGDRYLEIALSRACWTEAGESLCRRVERKWALGLQTFILKRVIMIMIMIMKMKMDVAPWCYKWDWMDGTGYIQVGWAV